MSPQPTEFYKELLIEFQCWNDCTSNWDHPPLVVIEEMIQDYNLIATLYNKAAKSASLEEAQIDECYNNISKVYDEIVATQKRRAINRPWEELQPVPARLHGERNEAVPLPQDRPLRLQLPDPARGENSSLPPPEMTLLPVAHNAAGVVAPKYLVSGAASKPPETIIKKFSKDEIPAFKGSDGLLLMQSNAAMYYNVANDDPHGTQDEPILAAQVTYWVLTDTEELPAACMWIFPAIGIGVLQFAITATEKAKKKVKIGLNQYLLTRTFPKGVRGDYGTAEPEQFVITASNEYDVKSAFMQVDLSSKKTEFKAKKLAEFFGNRRKKRKKKNSSEIQRRLKITKMTHRKMRRKMNLKLMKRMKRKIILMKRNQTSLRNLQYPQLSALFPAMSHYNADCLRIVQRH